MKKGNKTLMYITGGLAIGGLSYLIYNLLKRQPSSVGQALTDVRDTVMTAPNDAKAFITGKYVDCGFPLRKGCGGENVKSLQRFLNSEGNYGLVVDGKFGDNTENAVIENQNPFDTFKSMHPYAVKGQVSEQFFNDFIKGQF